MTGSSFDHNDPTADRGVDQATARVADSVLDRLVRGPLREHGPDAFKHLEILDRTSTLLAEAGHDLQAILRTITQQVAGLGVDLCVIRLLSEDGKWLVPAASYHPDPGAAPLLREILQVPQPADEGLQGYVVTQGEALLIPWLRDEEMRAIIRPHWSRYLEQFGVRSVLVVPLRARGRVLGGLGVFRSTAGDPYTYDDQVLVQELGDRAALAIDNTRLFERLSDRERELHELVGRLLLSQEEERRRVAYDVHDSLAQVAASAHQHLQAYAHQFPPGSAGARSQLERCLGLARETIREARRVIANLRPTALDDFGLEAAVRLQVEQLREAGWEVEYVVDTGNERLPRTVETALFRVAQEALANVRKHAGASRVHLSLTSDASEIRLEIQDWGKGFDPRAVSVGTTAGERVGLPGMNERIGLIGGTFRIESEPGRGTRVTAWVPMPEPSNGETE